MENWSHGPCREHRNRIRTKLLDLSGVEKNVWEERAFPMIEVDHGRSWLSKSDLFPKLPAPTVAKLLVLNLLSEMALVNETRILDTSPDFHVASCTAPT